MAVIRIEADGTRVYSNYTRYKPKPDHERKHRRRKPDDPRAYYWGGEWRLPQVVLPDEQRVMPLTRPDESVMECMSRSLACRCEVCRRPPEVLDRWIRRWQREHGL